MHFSCAFSVLTDVTVTGNGSNIFIDVFENDYDNLDCRNLTAKVY